jgi:hypothetical protein
MRLGGPQSRSWRGGEERNPCPCRELKPDRPAHNSVTILTELSRFLKGIVWKPLLTIFVVVVAAVFQALGLLACSGSEFIFWNLWIYGHLVRLLGRGVTPMQGLYLHRTTQHKKTRTHIHASSGIRTHDPSVWAAEHSTCLRPLGHWNLC